MSSISIYLSHRHHQIAKRKRKYTYKPSTKTLKTFTYRQFHIHTILANFWHIAFKCVFENPEPSAALNIRRNYSIHGFKTLGFFLDIAKSGRMYVLLLHLLKWSGIADTFCRFDSVEYCQVFICVMYVLCIRFIAHCKQTYYSTSSFEFHQITDKHCHDSLTSSLKTAKTSKHVIHNMLQA